jgi:DNA-binding LytR/AlgR family response regulator
MSSKRILVPHQNRIYVISYCSILYFKSDNCYCHIYLSNGRNYLLVKSLARLEKGIRDDRFLRISQSFLVNAHYITAIDKKKKVILLSDEHILPFTVSAKKLTELILGAF